MGWDIKAKRLREEFVAMSDEERTAMTWRDARLFVAPDTLQLAVWEGCKRSCSTPRAALEILLRIE